MILLGQYNTLRIVKFTSFGVYLDGGADGEILLPRRYVPEDVQEEDYVEVFIYHDNEGRLIATTDKPFGTVGEVANLRVREVSNVGAFMEWGIMKDLLVPYREQPDGMVAGRYYPVFIYIDEKTYRVVASARLRRFISNEGMDLKVKDKVSAIPVAEGEMGFQCVINHKHAGMLYRNEIFGYPVRIGEPMECFIKNIRPDNKIDLALQQQGVTHLQTAAEDILKVLQDSNGFLPLTDDSAPEEIYRLLKISKKAFKRSVGTLYKARKIVLEKDGIRLIK